MRADGTGLVYCGYVGGYDWDAAKGVAVDSMGRAYKYRQMVQPLSIADTWAGRMWI